MTVLTITVEPDEFQGLSALTQLERREDGGAADPAGLAHAMLREVLAARLREAGLPWAPSAEAVQQVEAEAARPEGRLLLLTRDPKVRRYAGGVAAVAALVVLWGGYLGKWQWTGFPANNQLWDWLRLLLLPVVVGTIPLWVKHGSYMSPVRRAAYLGVTGAFGVFVAAGYLVPMHWTGFPGNTLWNWFELLLLPAAVAIAGVWPAFRQSLRVPHLFLLALATAGWIVTIIGGYALHWTWTGYQGNTLWDWLALLLLPLVVPVALLPAVVTIVEGDAAQRAEQALDTSGTRRAGPGHRPHTGPAAAPHPPGRH